MHYNRGVAELFYSFIVKNFKSYETKSVDVKSALSLKFELSFGKINHEKMNYFFSIPAF
jgi:hypothetical protein